MNSSSPKLIAINGLSGSGKSAVSSRLRDYHGFEHTSSGALCRTITRTLFGHEERSALNQVSQAIRFIDQHIWIKAALRNTTGTRIVFDSVRYFEDANFLRSLGYEIWKIFCPIEICIERLRRRGQMFDMSDFTHDSEREIPDGFCSTIIGNHDCTLEELHAKIDALV